MATDNSVIDSLLDDYYAAGYLRGHDVATARAESRRRLGLPIDGDPDGADGDDEP